MLSKRRVKNLLLRKKAKRKIEKTKKMGDQESLFERFFFCIIQNLDMNIYLSFQYSVIFLFFSKSVFIVLCFTWRINILRPFLMKDVDLRKILYQTGR